MAELRRGDVVLVRFPFTDLRATKLRPAIVLASHGEDVIVVGVFSVLATDINTTWLLLDERDPSFAQTGLRKSSVAKGEKVAVLHRSVVHAVIGSLSPILLDAVARKVKAALLLP